MEPEEKFLDRNELDRVVDKIIRRDGDDLNFPQKSYALGGAGKQIIFSLLSNDWFLTELLLDPNRSTTQFYIIDTAIENKQRDLRYTRAIRNRLDTIKDMVAEKTDIGGTPEVEIKVTHLKDKIQVNAPHHFLGEETVDQILQNANDPDADTWWLTKDTLMEGNDMLETAKGVTRRRSLSKAFFYKTQANTDFMDEHVNLVHDDEYAAIFAGLGGGTGSGMAIDLAKYIRQTQYNLRITLFGILPTTVENRRERANAYAALSELEHLALSDDDSQDSDMNPFGDIVLTSIEKTGYTGRQRSTPDLENFDEAYPHVPIAYYNAPNLDGMFEDDTDYVPFTVAIPQVLRYDVRSRLQDRREAKEILDFKSEALDAERQVYDRVKAFQNEHYGNPDDEPYLYEEHADIIEQRFKRLDEFVNEVVPPGSDIDLEQAFNPDDDYVEKVESIRDFNQEPYRTLLGDDAGNEEGRDTGDMFQEDIENTIEDEFGQIIELYELLRGLSEVDDSTAIREVLEFQLDPERDPPQGLAKRLQSEQSRIGSKEDDDSKVGELHKEKENLVARRNERREKNEERVNEIYRDWYSDSEQSLSRLEELESIDFKSLFEDLGEKFSTFATNVETADKAEVQGLGDNLTEEVRQIDNELKEYGITAFEDDKERILNDIREVKRAREEWLNLSSGGGILDFGDPDTESYQAHYRTLSQHDTFLIPGYDRDDFEEDDFYVNVNYEPSHIQTRLREKIKQGRQYVLSCYEEHIEEHDEINPDPDYRSDLENLLGAGVRDNREKIESKVTEAIESEIVHDANESERISEIEDRVENLEAKCKRLEKAEELYRNSKSIVTRYEENYDSFIQRVTSTSLAKKRLTDSSDDLFVNYLDPDESQTNYQQHDSLAELDPFTNQELTGEAKAIKDYFQGVAERHLTRSDFTSIDNRPQAFTSKTQAFSDTEMNIAYISDVYANGNAPRLHDLLTGDVTNWLTAEYNVTDDKLGEWYLANGDPWEFSMTVFIQGLGFLDNLAPVVDNQAGYRDAYLSGTVGDLSDLARHAYGLERGFYVRRDTLHRPTENPDMYINGDVDIRAKFLDDHEVSEFETIVDEDEE